MFKTIVRSPITTIVLFVAAAALIVVGGIGAAQAAPRIVSNDYGAQVQLDSIQTALVENGSVQEGDDKLLKHIDATKFEIGAEYDEALAVRNTGAIDEYVRLTVTKYWTKDENGKQVKQTDLDPSYIKLTLAGNGWKLDESVSTDERQVYYYPTPISPGTDTAALTSKISIDKAVTDITKGDYQGAEFHISATCDAVQTHNGTAAMTGAWGRTV